MDGVKKYKFLKGGINLDDLRSRLSVHEGCEISDYDVRMLLDEVGIKAKQIIKPKQALDDYLVRLGGKRENYNRPGNYLVSLDDLIKLEAHHQYGISDNHVSKKTVFQKRLQLLIKWLESKSNDFDPHDHAMTQEQVWDCCGIENRSEGTRRAFFQKKEVKERISFKSGLRSY